MASGDATAIPVKNQAYRCVFPIVDADGDLVTGATGLDSEVSKDQGTFADATSEATEIATSSGIYYLDLTATEMNADCVAVIVKTTSSGAKTTVLVFYPQEAGDINVDVTYWNGTAVATPTTGGVPEVDVTHWLGTAAATPTVAGVPEVDITHIGGTAVTAAAGIPEVKVASLATGSITAGVIAADAIGASELAADAVAEIADAIWDEDATAHQTQGTFGQAIGDPAADANTIYGAVVTGATGATIAADIITIDDFLDSEISTLVGYGAPPTAAAIADAVLDEDMTAHQTTGTLGATLGDPGASTETLFKAIVTDPAGTNIAADIIAIKAETAAILDDTDDIGVAGAGLTALATQASVNTIDDLLDTEIGALTTAVADLPTNAELATALGTADDAVLAAIAALQLFVDTEVAAILADTNELQTDWVNGGRLDLLIDGIKAKTDSLTFTVANQVDANAVAVSGDTTAADRLEALMDGTITGTVNDAGATTTVFICAGFTPGANDRINGRLLTFTSGALAGEQTDITDWVHATSTITVTALTAAPANGVSFVIS